MSFGYSNARFRYSYPGNTFYFDYIARSIFVIKNKSEVAAFREQLALEEQAMRLGFSGPAIVASHAAINARMQRGAERILKLIEEDKHEEAIALMEAKGWGVEGE
jgi:hypothetical protein